MFTIDSQKAHMVFFDSIQSLITDDMVNTKD